MEYYYYPLSLPINVVTASSMPQSNYAYYTYPIISTTNATSYYYTSDNTLTKINDECNGVDEVLNLYEHNDGVELYFFEFWSYVGEIDFEECLPHIYNDQEIKKIEIELTCSICLLNKKTILFQNCGHFATCFTCSKIVKNKCPICSKTSQKTIRVYLS